MKYLATFSLLLGTLFNGLESLEVRAETHLVKNSILEGHEKILGKYYTKVFCKDWPGNSEVKIFEKRKGSPERVLTGYLFIKSENLSSSDVSEKGLQLIVDSIGYCPGEQTTYAFKDNKFSESVRIIPNPISARSLVDNANIYAILQSSFLVFTIVLKDFKKNEELSIEACSYDKTIKSSLTFTDDMEIVYLPKVIEKKGGIAKYSIIRSSGEILTLTIPWGFELIAYDVYYDENGNPIRAIDDPKFLQKHPDIADYFK